MPKLDPGLIFTDESITGEILDASGFPIVVIPASNKQGGAVTNKQVDSVLINIALCIMERNDNSQDKVPCLFPGSLNPLENTSRYIIQRAHAQRKRTRAHFAVLSNEFYHDLSTSSGLEAGTPPRLTQTAFNDAIAKRFTEHTYFTRLNKMFYGSSRHKHTDDGTAYQNAEILCQYVLRLDSEIKNPDDFSDVPFLRTVNIEACKCFQTLARALLVRQRYTVIWLPPGVSMHLFRLMYFTIEEQCAVRDDIHPFANFKVQLQANCRAEFRQSYPLVSEKIQQKLRELFPKYAVQSRREKRVCKAVTDDLVEMLLHCALRTAHSWYNIRASFSLGMFEPFILRGCKAVIMGYYSYLMNNQPAQVSQQLMAEGNMNQTGWLMSGPAISLGTIFILDMSLLVEWYISLLFLKCCKSWNRIDLYQLPILIMDAIIIPVLYALVSLVVLTIDPASLLGDAAFVLFGITVALPNLFHGHEIYALVGKNIYKAFSSCFPQIRRGMYEASTFLVSLIVVSLVILLSLNVVVNMLYDSATITNGSKVQLEHNIANGISDASVFGALMAVNVMLIKTLRRYDLKVDCLKCLAITAVVLLASTMLIPFAVFIVSYLALVQESDPGAQLVVGIATNLTEFYKQASPYAAGIEWLNIILSGLFVLWILANAPKVIPREEYDSRRIRGESMSSPGDASGEDESDAECIGESSDSLKSSQPQVNNNELERRTGRETPPPELPFRTERTYGTGKGSSESKHRVTTTSAHVRATHPARQALLRSETMHTGLVL